MKVLLELELRIDGECEEKFVRDNFLEWFTLERYKISPDTDDDDYQVWIDRITIKSL